MDPVAPEQAPKNINPQFTLSARQEQLLFAALNSNKPTNAADITQDSFSMAPDPLLESPLEAPGSDTLNGMESPFIDYDYEFDGEGGFADYEFANDSQGQMIGTLPGTSSDGDADIHDKRSHPDDDGDDEEGGGKRREGDEKTSKKPGRKPLTSEPTSKRKAQNRAAQRAFRERKEKHLKDLETKVEDLQKASESANHENAVLRAQIEKMSMELREYKKRVSLDGNSRNATASSGAPSYLNNKSLGGGLNNPNDVNFSFEFPRFGRFPGQSSASAALVPGNRQSASPSSTSQQTASPVENKQVSSRNQSLPYSPTDTSNVGITATPTQFDDTDMSSLSGLFSPSLLKSVSQSPNLDFFGSNTNGSRSSTDSAGQGSTGHNTSYSSPSASSNSQHGPSSSCGTSPEPSMQSPTYGKAPDSLKTIGEEQSDTFCDKLNMACGNPNNPIPQTMADSNSGFDDLASFDINGIDWLAQQNGNQFDPQLFGDYRESQDNILSGNEYSFFSDAMAIPDFPDFNSPFNVAPSPVSTKKDLVQQIDEVQNAEEEVVPADDPSQLLSCNTIWDRLQACPKVKDGDFDLDLLCTDLQKKAKCSETGAVVDERDFNKIMKQYVAKKTASNGTKA